MKKIISIISSIVLAAGMTTAMAANAVNVEDYKPSFFFKAEESTGVEVLKYGSVFVNRSTAPEGTKIPAAVYFSDYNHYAGQIFVKWNCEKTDLQLTDLTGPFAKAGGCPYKITGINSDADLVNLLNTFPELNMMAVNYTETNVNKPLQLTGTESDDYPLACFNAVFKSGAAGGSYDIEFYDQGNYFTAVVPRFPDDPKLSIEVHPAEYSEGLRINCSDRMLGDINDDKMIDAVDASSILAAYAKISSNMESGLSDDQLAAADVDGNKKVDAVDASNVLGYYAFISGTGTGTLNEFVKR